MKIYITGHIKPDLDSIVSAITYAEFLKKLKRYEGSELIPTIPGKINEETKFVLKKFEIDVPQSLDDIEIENTDAFILVDHNEQDQRHEKVVADQVRKLAGQSRQAVSNTESLLNKIKEITEIQNKAALEVVDAFNNLAALAEETSSSTEESAAAAEEQASSMEMVNQTAQELLKLASKLSNIK